MQNSPFDSHGTEQAEMLSEKMLSVAQLNRWVSHVLHDYVAYVWVKGEISNVTQAASGHWYLTLKDQYANVKGVMFKGRAADVGFRPAHGMEVEVYARVGLYEPRGEFQLNIEKMRLAGQGSLHEAFLKIKQKLAQEGLFDSERKKALPVFTQTVGVVTSLGAAALHDVLTALNRRAPHIRVIIYPSLVQGKEAPEALVQALSQADTRQEVDVVLLVRGGGSLEDLWAFNDERLARFIAQMCLPVVSGVGHETDVSISDFVADYRAPTPTAAAELVSTPRDSWISTIEHHLQSLNRHVGYAFERLAMRVDKAHNRLLSPQQRLQQLVQKQQFLQARLSNSVKQRVLGKESQWQQAARSLQSNKPDVSYHQHYIARLHKHVQRFLPRHFVQRKEELQWRYARLQRVMPTLLNKKTIQLNAKAEALHAYNPKAILKRGYAIVYNDKEKIVHHANETKAGEKLQIELASGQLNVRVLKP